VVAAKRRQIVGADLTRASPEFQSNIAKSQLQDLSIGSPGKDFESAFAVDMVEIRKIK
jgi:hypothetical protein